MGPFDPMDHYPDPYDDETEKRSRDYSDKALAACTVLAFLLLLGAIFINLRGE